MECYVLDDYWDDGYTENDVCPIEPIVTKVGGDDAGFRPYTSGLAKKWFYRDSLEDIEDKLEDLPTTQKARKRRLRLISSELPSRMPKDVPAREANEFESLLSAVERAISKKKVGPPDFVKIKQHFEELQRLEKQRRNNQVAIMLLLQ